jgi:malate dehydrogenase
VAGIPITQLMSAEEIETHVQRARTGGAEIVAFLKTGSAYYAPSSAAVQMAEAIVKDKKRILPCSAWLQGEYGMKDVFLGVPCKIGAKGIEQILEIDMNPAEKAALVKSADAVRETIAQVRL